MLRRSLSTQTSSSPYRQQVDAGMTSIVNKLLQYTSTTLPSDNFFRNTRQTDKGLTLFKKGIPDPPPPPHSDKLINDYITQVTTGRYPKDKLPQAMNTLSSFLNDDEILSKIDRLSLTSILNLYSRNCQIGLIQDFIVNKLPKTRLARDPLAFNFMFYTVARARELAVIKKIFIANETIDRMKELEVPVNISTWQCIYQLLNPEHSKILLNSMVENKFELDRLIWRIMEKSKKDFPSDREFVEFIKRNYESFPEFNEDELLKVYCFYNDGDGISELVAKFAREGELRTYQLKSLITRFSNNGEVWNCISMIRYFHDNGMDIPGNLRKQMFSNMLSGYLGGWGGRVGEGGDRAGDRAGAGAGDTAGDFTRLFIRYLFNRSLKNEGLERMIVRKLGRGKLAEVHSEGEKEDDVKFARMINEKLRWPIGEVRLRVDENDGEYQEVVKLIREDGRRNEVIKGDEIDGGS